MIRLNNPGVGKPQPNLGVSPADAKHVLSEVEGAARKKKNLSDLGVLGALAGVIYKSEMFHVLEKLREIKNPRA
ncbi:MAG: hypothetical protein OEN50_14960 [Deltaproteobacteria bacterium]|nr:hypothetical protein [Deltaproteobacteria bacterium]